VIDKHAWLARSRPYLQSADGRKLGLRMGWNSVRSGWACFITFSWVRSNFVSKIDPTNDRPIVSRQLDSGLNKKSGTKKDHETGLNTFQLTYCISFRPRVQAGLFLINQVRW